MRVRRSDPHGPGYRRLRGNGFSYLDQIGRPLTDPGELERLRSLAIPPGWRDVWICPAPHRAYPVGSDEYAEGEDAPYGLATLLAVSAVMRAVAADLGNTPAVARTSYVDPRVLDVFLHDGTVVRLPARARSATVRERAVLDLLTERC